MASDETDSGESDGPGYPDFLRPGIRCGLEMVLAGGLVLLVGLPAENDIYYGAVVSTAIVVMVVVLFWALNRQMQQWVDVVAKQQRQELRRQRRKRMARNSGQD